MLTDINKSYFLFDGTCLLMNMSNVHVHIIVNLHGFDKFWQS